MTKYVLFIEWGKSPVDGYVYESPPIGPFEGITAARTEATRYRKALRARGHPFKRIRPMVLKSPEQAWAWMR